MVKGKAGPRPGPKTAKIPKPKPAKAPKVNPPAAKNPRAQPGANKVTLSEDEKRASFLQFNQQVTVHRAKVEAAEKLLKGVFSDAKAAGFAKKMFDIAKALGDVKGEKKIKAEVGERLQVARWMGHPLGAQMDLFEQPDRTPIVDRAYDEGRTASMSSKPRDPSKYSPDTDAYRAWLAGFDDHQRELHGGFKKLEPRTDQIENQVAQRAEREAQPSASASLAAKQGIDDDDFEDGEFVDGDDDSDFA